jgi:hypothetical protein
MIGNANDHTPIPISRAPDTHGEAGKELCMVERQAIRGNLPARAGGAAGTADARNACIVGIDPGASTGVAYFTGGQLRKLETIAPHQIPAAIKCASRVIFEDSRLISHMFTTVKSRPAALKMARNVGEIDAWCRLIVATCADLGIDAHGISPKQKGAKLDAAQFAAKTGWCGKSNAHERDAAMCAWPYRGAK